MGKNHLKDILNELDHRKRSMDALRLLIEGGDFEMAHVVASKLRGDLDVLIAELDATLGHEPAPAPAAPASPATPSAERAPVARRPIVSRGYLGDDDGPGKLERWVDSLVRAAWDAVANPRATYQRFSAYRGRLLFIVAIVVFGFTATRAYEKVFLSRYGLMGEYYLDTDLKTLYGKRLDHTINFRWLRRPPMHNFRAEQFSIRWTGFIRINEPDLYEFYTISDDGVRLWIDNQKLIDNWEVHGATLDKGEVRLTPGYHSVRIEYYQGSGDMVMKFHWRRPADHQKKVVAARYLYPTLPQE